MTKFFSIIFFTIVPVVLLNIVIGLYWSLRFARPIRQVEQGLDSVRNGHLDAYIQLSPQDTMRRLVKKFNDMTAILRSLILQDRKLALDAAAELEKLKETLNALKDRQLGDSLRKALTAAQSKLTVINVHFARRMPRDDR